MGKIVFQNPCSLDALRKIAVYEKRLFGKEAEAMPFSKMLSIWRKNPYMFNSLMDGPKLLGYANIFAMNEDGAKMMNMKKSIEERIDVGNVCDSLRMKNSPLLYFEAIAAVGSGEGRKKLVAMLMYGRAKFLETRFNLPKLAYVVPVTNDGLRLARTYDAVRFGSVTLYDSCEKHEKHGFYRFRVSKDWCKRVKERASKRAVPTMIFKKIR
jgi:hypothetical protein